MSWGASWGRRWGGGQAETAVAFAIESARAHGSNSFRVTFTKQPLFNSPIDPGDASRLSNWVLARTDAAQRLTLMTTRSVIGQPNVVEFIIAERWPSFLAEYSITGSAALLAVDAQESIMTPAAATFLGAPAAAPATEQDTRGEVDIYNPQDIPDQLNGGLVVGSDGDYQKERGLTLLKKKIQRRIFTAQNEFLHLSDRVYGLGVRAKGFFRPADLAEFQRQLQMEVLAEPEVIEAAVLVVLAVGGTMTITVRARTNFGPLELDLPVAGLAGAQGVQL